jgi:hypothetical protein
MPIELWWWVEPLFSTGLFTLIIFTVTGLMLDDVMPHSRIPTILACIGVIPLTIAVLTFFAWISVNVLFVIWGC